MLHFAPRMTAVLLSASMLAGCASAAPDIAKLTGGNTAADHAQKEAAAANGKIAPTDLEGGIRQAQLMRFAGKYDDAIRVLSQLMLVASDDPRVVAEYGKSLAEKGRAQDAVQFMNRAIELSSNDWTLYSALGVSYDQLSNQAAARTAYEHALALRPEEPSVLNNYALSRMLAGDADGARNLIARAQAAGGASDSKIAANIALLNQVAPQAESHANVSAALQPVATGASLAASSPPPTAQAKPPQQTIAQTAPRPLVPNLPPVAPRPPQATASTRPAQIANGVVMQAVPVDPYAGPVVAHGAHAKVAVAAKPDATKSNVAKTDTAKTAAPKPVVKTADAKPAIPVPVIIIEDKPAAQKTQPIKTADAKPLAKPATPVRTASQVPALRLTADARSP